MAGADVKPISLQLWPGGCDPPCQQKGFRAHTEPSLGAGSLPCSPCLGRYSGRARSLGSGRGGSCWQWCPPPPSSAEGSAGVGFGCPPFACPQGPASCVADPPWAKQGPWAAPTRASPQLVQGNGCQQGHWPAWRVGISHCCSCHQIPACFIVMQCALWGCWYPVTLSMCDFGPSQGKCPFLCLAPSEAGSCHKSQSIPVVMLQFSDPSSQAETPTCVPHIHRSCPHASHCRSHLSGAGLV